MRSVVCIYTHICGRQNLTSYRHLFLKQPLRNFAGVNRSKKKSRRLTQKFQLTYLATLIAAPQSSAANLLSRVSQKNLHGKIFSACYLTGMASLATRVNRHIPYNMSGAIFFCQTAYFFLRHIHGKIFSPMHYNGNGEFGVSHKTGNSRISRSCYPSKPLIGHASEMQRREIFFFTPHMILLIQTYLPVLHTYSGM